MSHNWTICPDQSSLSSPGQDSFWTGYSHLSSLQESCSTHLPSNPSTPSILSPSPSNPLLFSPFFADLGIELAMLGKHCPVGQHPQPGTAPSEVYCYLLVQFPSSQSPEDSFPDKLPICRVILWDFSLWLSKNSTLTSSYKTSTLGEEVRPTAAPVRWDLDEPLASLCRASTASSVA